MKRLSRMLSCMIAILFFACAVASSAAPKKPKVDPDAALRAALNAAQTMYYGGGNFYEVLFANFSATAANATATKAFNAKAAGDYSSFVTLYTALQAMNRYQVLPSTAGADLILIDDAGGWGVQVLDGKTLQRIGTLKMNAFTALSREKWAASITKQLLGFAGNSKSAKAIVVNPPPSFSAWMGEGIGDAATSSRLQAAHSILIADQSPNASDGTFRFAIPVPDVPGQLASMLQSDLTTWGRYQVVSKVADADLVTSFYSASNCSYAGSTTEYVGKVKESVPNLNCSGSPVVGLIFLDAKTLLPVGFLQVDAPPISNKKGQPDPRGVAFQVLIDAWKSKIAAATP